MGWWNIGETSESGVQLCIGDTPADHMGECFDRITAAYREEIGRVPTKRELERCFEFVMGGWENKIEEELDTEEGRQNAYLASIDHDQFLNVCLDLWKEAGHPLVGCMGTDIMEQFNNFAIDKIKAEMPEDWKPEGTS